MKHLVLFLKEPAFIYLTVGGNLTLLLASLLVYFFEKGTNSQIKTLFDAFWWGVATITTIGYGDVVPTSLGGRLVGLALMYTGTILFIAFTSLFASYWLRLVMEKDIAPLEKDVRREQRAMSRIEGLLEEINQRLHLIEKKQTAEKISRNE